MAVKKAKPNISGEATPEQFLKKVPRSGLPKSVKPMLATLVNDPFDDPEWSFEVKWDGYRTIAYVDKGKATLSSRNAKPFTDKYYPISEALSKWGANAVLDGEIVVLGKDGKANFEALQGWRSEADGDLFIMRSISCTSMEKT